ncbi:MAG: hypothetical protein RLZZ330_707 [Actinomycetota bacterium]|jgi:biotin transport system substrate-specific component
MAITATPRTLIETFSFSWAKNLVAVFGATAFIAAMAQVSIPLPFTPVPLTGQTLAVLLTISALGAYRSIAATSMYLVAALIGLPVLAPQTDGSHITGTSVFTMASFGYVAGFIVASFVIGKLAERGMTKTILKTAVLMIGANVIIYSLGLLNLKSVTGASWSEVISWGLTPFVIGDLIKILIAANLLPATWKMVQRLK